MPVRKKARANSSNEVVKDERKAEVTEEFAGAPGFKFSSLADGDAQLLPQVVRDLKLDRAGLECVKADPGILALSPDGRTLPISPDVKKTAQAIAETSPTDASCHGEMTLDQFLHMRPVSGYAR